MRSAHPAEANVSALDPRHNHTANDLFPETLPPVSPAIIPTRGTRAGEAWEALLDSPQNQADYWQGWRLSAYVKSLEYLGWSFIKRDITRPGCRRAITEYTLDRTDPRNAAALTMYQKGGIDLTLAGLLVLAGVCALLLLGMPT